jgi:hypothetical protein
VVTIWEMVRPVGALLHTSPPQDSTRITTVAVSVRLVLGVPPIILTSDPSGVSGVRRLTLLYRGQAHVEREPGRPEQHHEIQRGDDKDLASLVPLALTSIQSLLYIRKHSVSFREDLNSTFLIPILGSRHGDLKRRPKLPSAARTLGGSE